MIPKKMEEFAAKEIKRYRENAVIREFVENEAYGKIAEEVRAKTDTVCTAKAAFLLVNNDNNPAIMGRWEKYCAAGYCGVFLSSLELHKQK